MIAITLSQDRTARNASRIQHRRRRFDVGDGQGDDAVAGAIRVTDDVEPAAIHQSPHLFLLVGDDVGGATEEPFVPSLRRVEVAHRYAGEEDVDLHRLSPKVSATFARGRSDHCR